MPRSHKSATIPGNYVNLLLDGHARPGAVAAKFDRRSVPSRPPPSWPRRPRFSRDFLGLRCRQQHANEARATEGATADAKLALAV
jgi:hypothetical protein